MFPGALIVAIEKSNAAVAEVLVPADLSVADACTLPMPGDQKPDRAKRRQILEGANHVFLTHGFDAASMGAIALHAGVSKGTLYVYFKSKEELFGAIVEDQRSSAYSRIETAV